MTIITRKYEVEDKDGNQVWSVSNRAFAHQAPPTADLNKFKAYDHDGNALAGGKVYTYESGTSTEYTTFSDPALTVPNDNPVILDANGEADIYCEEGYMPKLILKDANDVQYWSIDYYAEIMMRYIDEVYPADSSGGDSTANNLTLGGTLTVAGP